MATLNLTIEDDALRTLEELSRDRGTDLDVTFQDAMRLYLWYSNVIEDGGDVVGVIDRKIYPVELTRRTRSPDRLVDYDGIWVTVGRININYLADGLDLFKDIMQRGDIVASIEDGIRLLRWYQNVVEDGGAVYAMKNGELREIQGLRFGSESEEKTSGFPRVHTEPGGLWGDIERRFIRKK